MSNENKKPYLNALVEPRRLKEIEEAYDNLKKYALEKGLSKPNKGLFISDIIGEGIQIITPEVFFSRSRS